MHRVLSHAGGSVQEAQKHHVHELFWVQETNRQTQQRGRKGQEESSQEIQQLLARWGALRQPWSHHHSVMINTLQFKRATDLLPQY